MSDNKDNPKTVKIIRQGELIDLPLDWLKDQIECYGIYSPFVSQFTFQVDKDILKELFE